MGKAEARLLRWAARQSGEAESTQPVAQLLLLGDVRPRLALPRQDLLLMGDLMGDLGEFIGDLMESEFWF